MKTRIVPFLMALAAAIFLTGGCANTGFSNRSQAFTFVQLCDPQLGYSDYERDKASLKQAVIQINRLKPDFVVICGDMVNTAGKKSYTDFKEITREFKMDYYCVPGNHDVGNQPTAQTLQDYRKIMGRDYFTLKHKGAAFIFINTQLFKEAVPGESEKQDAWLKKSLQDAAKKGQPVFIVGHYPLFGRAADEPDEYMNLPAGKRAELLSLFEQYPVAAVIGGHTHKIVQNTYHNIQMVNAETTSTNHDGRPLGFRLWQVTETGVPSHEFVPLETAAP